MCDIYLEVVPLFFLHGKFLHEGISLHLDEAGAYFSTFPYVPFLVMIQFGKDVSSTVYSTIAHL